MLSPLLVVCLSSAFVRRSLSLSWPPYARLVLVLPRRGSSNERWSAEGETSDSVAVLEIEVLVEASRNELDRNMSLGGAACCVCSYEIASNGIEFERRLICFRATMRWEVVRMREGILACIFFARRQNDFTCWLEGVKGRPSPGSRMMGMAY